MGCFQGSSRGGNARGRTTLSFLRAHVLPPSFSPGQRAEPTFVGSCICWGFSTTSPRGRSDSLPLVFPARMRQWADTVLESEGGLSKLGSSSPQWSCKPVRPNSSLSAPTTGTKCLLRACFFSVGAIFQLDILVSFVSSLRWLLSSQ